MSEPVFYTHPQSRGRIVRWMMEELGEPCQTVWLDYGGTMKAPEYPALNPMGKASALRDGDTVVTESAAICADRSDHFPQRGLAPPPTCCRARRWGMMIGTIEKRPSFEAHAMRLLPREAARRASGSNEARVKGKRKP